jgi:tetratricopeptide (TPR) repeat protein
MLEKALALEPFHVDAISEYGELVHASVGGGGLTGDVLGGGGKGVAGTGGGLLEAGLGGVDGGAEALEHGGDGDEARGVVGYAKGGGVAVLRDAQEYYEEALKLDPRHVPTLVRYGLLCQALNDTAASMGLLVQALDIQPWHAGALAGVGYLHQCAKNVVAAHRYYARALEADPSHVDALSNYAALLFNSGSSIMEREAAWNKAEDMYERAVLLSPNHVRSLYNFGIFQEGARHDADKAELLYRTALARSPNHVGALVQLAQILMEGGRDIVGAQDLLEQALALDPQDVDALCQQAHLLYVHKDDLLSAEVTYKRVLQISPDYVPALNSMAGLHLARGDEDDVARVVARALQVAPDDADTVLNSAALMWEKEFCRRHGAERNASAAGCLVQRALELDPVHVGALCFHGMWYLQAHNDAVKGMECMEQALKLDPSSVIARDGHQWMQDECRKLAYREGHADPYNGEQKVWKPGSVVAQGPGARPGPLPQGGVENSMGNGAVGEETGGKGMGVERQAEDESEVEVEGPRRGPYYESVGDGLHPLPANLPAGTVIGGEGTFGVY